MNLHYQYYWFKEVIPHDMCDKIIQMGNKRIKQIKKNGDDASGTTRGNGEKTKNKGKQKSQNHKKNQTNPTFLHPRVSRAHQHE